MKRVFILGPCRTPIGKFGESLSRISAVDLAAIVIRESIKRAGISPDHVDHVCMGCVFQAGLGQNVSRQAAIKAGIPYSTTAETLNMVCGSGLDSILSAVRMIQTGEVDIVVAGGTENMSQAPFAVPQARFGYRMGNPMQKSELVDTMVKDGLWDAFNDCHMGVTAENIANRWKLDRRELDEFAVWSQEKACRAVENGEFLEEIVPVTTKEKNRDLVVDTDEGPRKGVTVKQLERLRPVFMENGIITAGNSSGISDGAAAVTLASEEKVRELGLSPMAEFVGGALSGVDPAIMGIAPVFSTKKLLKKFGMTINDIDFIEGNEAFAAQAIAVAKELEISVEKFNVNGGAIALGHPIGASGCRILVTLLYIMKKRQAATGLATLCIGGGMGCSVVVRYRNNNWK